MNTDDLRERSGPVWDRLLGHGFPQRLADGTLPPERYRFYLSQNLCYLPDYARMLAVGAARSRDAASLADFTRALVNIVEVEIPQNERMLAQAEELAGEQTSTDRVPAPATVAYTSWLLAIAGQGDSDDIAAALLPCAWSYGEIATRLAPTAVDHPAYGAWTAFFSSAAYAEVVAELRASFDRRLAELPTTARERAAGIFLTGCRMEEQFWDQGLTGQHWPDLTAA